MKKKNLALGIIAYLALIALCVIIVYVIPSVRGMLVRTYLAEQGDITLTNEVEAYVVRDEVVYTAEKAATVNRIIDEGTMVKAGTAVVELAGEGVPSSAEVYTQILNNLGDAVSATESGKTKSAGYISYHVDGAESKLGLSVVEDMKKSELETNSGVELKDAAKGQCAPGDPVFKVVHNKKYYFIFYLKKDEAKDYYVGDSVELDIDGEQISADVAYIKEGKSEVRIALKCGMFYKNALNDRKVKAMVTTSSARGLVLEDKSIIEKKGKKGVLVKNKLGNYIFKPVCIKADDGENCVAYQDIFMDEESNFVETISIYDEIVARPSKKDIEEAE